jgi:hypothetical protein
LKIWTSQIADDVNFNDTVFTRLPVVTQAVSGAFTETFEGLTEAPLGWVVGNPDWRGYLEAVTELQQPDRKRR